MAAHVRANLPDRIDLHVKQHRSISDLQPLESLDNYPEI
jgi:hypothetical protein